MQDVGQDAGAREVLPGPARFGLALLRQRNIDPPGESVLEIPRALAVPQQHEPVSPSHPFILP